SGRRLLRDLALSESGRGDQKRRRRQGGRQSDESTADRGFFGWQGLYPLRRPQDPSSLSLPADEAGRFEISGRRLQRAGHHTCGRGIPPAEGWWFRDGHELNIPFLSPPRAGRGFFSDTTDVRSLRRTFAGSVRAAFA